MKTFPLASALVLAALSLAVPGRAGELRLTQDGQPVAAIILGPGVNPADLATKVLVSNLQQMSGATLPVLTEKSLGALQVEGGRVVMPPGRATAENFIFLGEGETTQRLGIKTDTLGAGGIALETSGNVLALLARDDGSDSRSPAIARPVFQLLETLGCRNLWPGESGKVMPQRKSVVVPDLHVRYTPSVGQRNIRFAALETRGAAEGLAMLGATLDDYRKAKDDASRTEAEGTWAAWNGLGGNIGIVGGAAGAGLRGGWAEHGAAHPEWFALQADGTRDQSLAKERWRLCVSNQGLIEHVAADIVARLKEKPQSVISLCPNDGGYSSFCLCPECQKLDAPNAPKVKMLVFDHVGSTQRQEVEHPALTDRFVHYWNAVAERVTKEFPNQLFLVEAYSYYSDAPVREKLHPNLVLRYVPNTADAWKGWQAAGATRVYWRPNNLHSGYRDGVLSPRARDNAETERYLASHGMLATDMDSIYNHWATQGLHYYSCARLSWNPTLTFDAVLDDYCRSGFGVGAEEVKKYFLRMEQGVVPVVVEGRGQFPQITPETIAALRASLVAAAKATEQDAPSHRRVAFLRAGLEFTAASAEAQRLASSAKDGAVDAKAASEVMERRWQLMRALLQQQPLAVNVGVVAANDGPLNAALGWKGPSELVKSGKLVLPKEDDWLNGDQSATRK